MNNIIFEFDVTKPRLEPKLGPEEKFLQFAKQNLPKGYRAGKYSGHDDFCAWGGLKISSFFSTIAITYQNPAINNWCFVGYGNVRNHPKVIDFLNKWGISTGMKIHISEGAECP